MSAGPEAPRGSGFPAVPSPRAASGLPVSAGSPRLGDPRGLGARGGLARAAPSGRARVRVLWRSGGAGGARAGGRGAQAGREVRGRGRAPARGRGQGRTVTGRRRKEGVTPIPAAGLPSPRPARGPRGGPAAGRGRGLGWGRGAHARERARGRGCPAGSALRPGPDFLLRGAPPRTCCGGRGRGGERAASAAGRGRPGTARLGLGLGLRRARRAPRAARLLDPTLRASCSAVSVCLSGPLPACSAAASLSGSYLTRCRNRPPAACPIPLLRGKFSLFLCFLPPPLSPREMQGGRLRHRTIRGESFNSYKSGTQRIKTAVCHLSGGSPRGVSCLLPNASCSEMIFCNPGRLRWCLKARRV